MKEICITIDESKIINRIFSESGYAALARRKAGIPGEFTDIVHITDDDKRVIAAFISDSIDEAAGLITRYLAPCPVSAEKCSGNGAARLFGLHLTVSSNIPATFANAAKELIESFSTSRTLQQWMLTVKPDEANIHASKAQGKLVQLRELLAARTRPSTATFKDNTIIEF